MRDISTSSESENKQDVASNLATTSTLGHQSLFLSFRLVRRDWKKQWKIDTTLYSITNANWGNKCWWITTSAVQGWIFSGKSAHCLLSSFVAYKTCKTIPHVSGSRNSKYHRDRASISNTFVHLHCSNTSACMACYATALVKNPPTLPLQFWSDYQIGSTFRLSVRLSVIVSKWAKLASWFLRRWRARRFLQISGSSWARTIYHTGVSMNWRFLTFNALYLWNGARED